MVEYRKEDLPDGNSVMEPTGHSKGPHIHHGVNDFHIDGLEPNAVEINADNISSEVIEESDQTVLEAILVTNMRIYDVLMAVYNKLDNPRATQLMKLHRQGHLLNEEEYKFDGEL